MSAYYNEIDPAAAQWLRNLIAAGHIAPGYVDERSIEDVTPGDLAGYTQCHFFAGIGVWSYALRQAGWSDDRPIWTGSCPCQPFSSAGAQAGFDDERHLWPHFQWLIEQCRPAIVFGEQVASKAVEPWIDLVQADMEGLGYAFAGIPFPSAGVGAPHIRDRLFWVADAKGKGKHGAPGNTEQACAEKLREEQEWHKHDCGCTACRMADAGCEQREWRAEAEGLASTADTRRRREDSVHDKPRGLSSRLADTEHDGCGGSQGHPTEPRGNQQNLGVSDRGHSVSQGQPPTGPTNGFWGAADWLLCRDGKWRPVEPGTFPLAHGASARVVRLRAYGNAINAEAAREFIGSVMECIG